MKKTNVKKIVFYVCLILLSVAIAFICGYCAGSQGSDDKLLERIAEQNKHIDGLSRAAVSQANHLTSEIARVESRVRQTIDGMADDIKIISGVQNTVSEAQKNNRDIRQTTNDITELIERFREQL